MRYVINGGKKLFGTIENQGSKNEALAILAIAIFLRKKIIISNVPNISDIFNFLKIGKSLNLKFKYDKGNVLLDATKLRYEKLDSDLVKSIRASIYYLPILVSLNESFEFYYPGGCNFGKRPIDFHLNLLKSFGFDYTLEKDKIVFSGEKVYVPIIYLPYPSFGTTINAILLGLNTKKPFKIVGCAEEPEIKSVLNFLKKLGWLINDEMGSIYFYGYSKKKIETYEISFDRISAATFCCLGALIGKNIVVKNCPIKEMTDFFTVLDSGNIEYKINKSNVKIYEQKYSGKNFYVSHPYPGLSTDLIPCLVSLFSAGRGMAFIEDKVYHSRKKYLEELKKLNANINVIDELIVVLGNENIVGNTVKAVDLRGGMAAVLLGIKAKGKTVIENKEIIERGYENILEKFIKIGVDIYEE